MHRQIAGRLTGPVTKWVVVVIALLIAGGMSTFSAKLVDVQNNEAASWLPSSAESTKVLEELSATVDPNDIPTLVVYHRSSGLTDEDFARMDEQAAEIAEIDGVTERGVLSPGSAQELADQGQQVPPLVSEDGEVAYLYLVLNFGANGWNDIPPVADEIRDIADIEGGVVHLAGFGGQAADSAESFEGIDTNLIMITLMVVIVILLLTYRSPVLWLLPIICVVVANTVATGLIYLLAKYADLTVNGQSQAILSILVIGAGTDYALLLVARYREELRRHADRHEAMAVALHRAAPAILASAATVAVGMLCLVFADLNSTAGLGPVNAIGIAVTFVVMVTLLPALLVCCGRWVFWPKRPTFGSPEPTTAGLWAKVGRRISVRPRGVWLVTTGLLLLACLGLFRLDTSGLSTEDTYTKEFDSILGQKLLTEHGLADNSNTIQVVTDSGELASVQDALSGVAGLGTPTEPQAGRLRPRLLRADRERGHLLDGGVRDRRVRPRCGPRRGGCRRPRGRRVGVLPRHQGRLEPRRTGDHPDRAAGRVPDPRRAAPSAGDAADLDGDGRAVLRSGAGALGVAVRVRLRLRRLRPELPVVRLRVPGRAGDRLQHLPDDPGAGGDRDPRHAEGFADRVVLHGWRDHVGRTRAGGHLPGAGLPSPGVPRASSASRSPSACCSTP